MRDIGRWVVWGLFPSILAGVIINNIVPFETIDSAIFGEVLADPILRVFGLIIVLVVPFYFGIDYLISLLKALLGRRKEIKSSNSPGVSVAKNRPTKLHWHGVVRHFGVDWFVTYGEPRRGSARYAYIERGPCCPNCQTEMLYRNKTKLLAFKHRIWLCPECECVIDRPKEMLFEEERGVRNIVEKHIEIALSADDPESYVQSLKHFESGRWGNHIR